MLKEKVNVEIIKGEFGPCEICDNWTERVSVDNEIGCLICWEAYGELN